MEFPVMEIGHVYFYTATILKWQNLLKPDKYKDIIISSLKYLVDKKKLEVYAFVIMPNHIHIIWKMLEMNGKELPSTSFMKFTGHCFLKDLKENYPHILPFFEVNTSTRQHHFWQRNSLPIMLYSEKVFKQKMDYIHLNPLQEKWHLADAPTNYKYSSARFYEEGIDIFGILSVWND